MLQQTVLVLFPSTGLGNLEPQAYELTDWTITLTHSRRLEGTAQGCVQDNAGGRRSSVVSPGRSRAKYKADEVSEVYRDNLFRSSSSNQDIISL